jgi:hypothetical protein
MEMKTIYAHTGQSPAVGYVGYINVRPTLHGIAFTVRSEGRGTQGEIILSSEQSEQLAVDLLAHIRDEPSSNLQEKLTVMVDGYEEDMKEIKNLRVQLAIARLTALEDVAALATVGATYPELMDYLQEEIKKCENNTPNT